MTPAELLDVIDHGLDAGERYPVQVHAPVVLGIKGRLLGHAAGQPVYGFSRRQCRRLRRIVLDAAREDLERAQAQEPPDGP